MKRTIKVLLVLFVAIIVTGCGESKKEAINPNKFITIADNYSYTVKEATSNYDYANSAYYYTSDFTNIFFIEGKESATINTLYMDEVTNYANEAGTEAKTTTKKGDNYSIFMAANKDYFFFVGRVGKTIIKAKTRIDNKNKMVKFLTEIGYY